MPNLNRTGPEGMGAGTGRGMGYCGSGRVDNFNRRGMRNFGRFQPSRWLNPSISDEEKKSFLGEEEKALKERLEEIKKEKKDFK
ncbi:DUF5320 domain-containing protein [bacterium]|nr:DUF5320 domain-containing protein [bacterium]